MHTVSERQHGILNCVVETHIETALPVGSRVVRERYCMDFSPATVRHEMGLLEDGGYLVQPHTSSGRVPTDQGYRYYVDHCLTHSRGERHFFGQVYEELVSASRESEDSETVMEQASRLLSDSLRQTGLVCAAVPDLAVRRVRRRFYMQGWAHMLEKPEFQDLGKLRALASALDQKSRLSDWMDQRVPEKGTAVCIGREHNLEELQECSIVSARCYFMGSCTGTLAIIGPRRMSYARAVPFVEKMAGLIGKILQEKH